LDLQRVLATIVQHAVHLSETDAGAIYEYDETSGTVQARVVFGWEHAPLAAVRSRFGGPGQRLEEAPLFAQAASQRQAIQVPDLSALQAEADPQNRFIYEQAGFRAALIAPLLREEQLFGLLVVRRKTPGAFGEATVALLETFATQSALAIQNA